MSMFLRGAGAFFGTLTTGAVGYRTYRSFAKEWEKEADPTKLNARERFTKYASVNGGVMTTEDFVASITSALPTISKDVRAISYDSLERVFRKIDANDDKHLSYQEYCMFVTLVSTDVNHFKMAFKMFDVNENGKVDIEDFKRMMKAVVVDPSVKLSFKGGVVESFFGRNYEKSLSFDQFMGLVDDLRKEVRTAEFRSLDQEKTGAITFSQLQKLFNLEPAAKSAAEGAKPRKVTLQNYHNIVNVLLKSDTIGRALDIYNAGYPEEEGCGKGDLVRALRCADIRLNSTEVDILFDLFDIDGSGKIDGQEFTEIAKRKKSFFVQALPRFDQPQRNTIQQFAFCMQQRE